MKKSSITYIVYLLLLFIPALTSCTDSDKTKIACIGDSLTYGDGIIDRSVDSYPAQLGEILGENWEVKNYGICAATALKTGDVSYWNLKELDTAINYNADVVIMMFGANDSKPQNWKGQDSFKQDYSALIEKFSNTNASPQFYLCIPTPAFEPRWNISDSILASEIKDVIYELSKEYNAPIIDFRSAFADDENIFPDKIHPNAIGTNKMARSVAQIVSTK